MIFVATGDSLLNAPLRLRGVESEAPDYELLRRSLHLGLTDDSRQMTAQAIRDTKADLVCVQEVENCNVLADFNKEYLEKSIGIRFGWLRVLHGNDNRGIDVGVMAMQRIVATSHATHTYDDFGLFNTDLENYGLSPDDRIFRRDCLEVETIVGGSKLTIFVCHFKSMSDGRETTRPIREAEAKAVREIICRKFANPSKEPWIVAGDLNDYTEHEDGTEVSDHSLRPFA